MFFDKNFFKQNVFEPSTQKKLWVVAVVESDLVFSLGLGQAEQELSPDLSFVIQNFGPNFRPAVNILLVYFGGGFLLFFLLLLQG